MDEKKDSIIHFGGAVKALGDGRVGGYLVRFGNEDDVDLEGDFFAKDTKFGTNRTPPVVFHHGMDNKLKTRILCEGAIKADDIGLWIEAQLELRDEYEKFIYSRVEAGKMGWSSGALSHLYEAEPVGKANKIKTWIIGEASITPTPAEPRNTVIPVKSLLEGADGVGTDNTGDETEKLPEEKEMTKQDENVKAADNAAKEAEAQAPAPVALQIDTDAIAAKAAAEAIKAFAAQQTIDNAGVFKAAPAVLKTGLGDNPVKAYAWFVKTGDGSGIKASNDTDMNVGTSADGGYAVPTGHYNEIIARRDEGMLANLLGVRNIPGTGTTVNVPLDAEGDGEFVATGEASAFDRDAPALGQKALTLVKYTKKVELSYELLEDEDSRIMAFLSDFVARGMAKTHNSLLLTEVAANGTALKTFAATGAIAAGEPEDIVSNDNLGAYLDDTPSVAWVMRNSTFYDVASITGNPRMYAETPGGSFSREILGYPVRMSNKAAAIAGSAKSVYFGNWNFVGKREAPGFTVLRDPYSKASSGQVVLHYYFRTVYGVLQSEAIGYGVHPSA